jgi:hypothetical protein
MVIATNHMFSMNTLDDINYCCMLLHVTILAEITNWQGTAILPDAVIGTTNDDGHLLHGQHNHSLMPNMEKMA